MQHVCSLCATLSLCSLAIVYSSCKLCHLLACHITSLAKIINQLIHMATDQGRCGEPKLLWAMTAMLCCWQKSTKRCWSKYGCISICNHTQTHRTRLLTLTTASCNNKLLRKSVEFYISLDVPWNILKTNLLAIQVPSSNVGQNSPVGLGCHVGPLAIPKKLANILGTESLGKNSREHNYPCPHDYSLYCGAHQRISQAPQETTWQAAQPNSRPATWAVQPPTPAMPRAKRGK